MPMIVAKIETLKTPEMMQDNLIITLRKAGIPQYSWKEQRAGFEVRNAEHNEGETQIIWHSFAKGDAEQDDMRAGLEQCAAILLENHWVQLYVPNRRKLMYERMHLRVLRGLSWLK